MNYDCQINYIFINKVRYYKCNTGKREMKDINNMSVFFDHLTTKTATQPKQIAGTML